jgi:hypothetical protein
MAQLDGYRDYLAALEKIRKLDFTNEKEYRLALLEIEKAKKKENVSQLEGAVEQKKKELEIAKKGAKEGSKVVLEAEVALAQARKQLAEANIEDQKANAEQEKEVLTQRFEVQKNLIESALGFIENLYNEYYNRIERRLDNQLNATQRRADMIRGLAETGTRDVVDNFAFEAKREAEIQREKERLERKRARNELIISALRSYAKNVNDPSVANPFQKTLGEVLQMQALIRAIPSFDKGTTYFDGSANIDGKGGALAVVHEGERIVPTYINKGFENVPHTALFDAYRLREQMKPQDDGLGEKIDKLIKVVENKAEFVGLNYNEITRAIIETIKKGNTTTNNHKPIREW